MSATDSAHPTPLCNERANDASSSRTPRTNMNLLTTDNLLLVLIVIGVVVGISLGAGLHGRGLTDRDIMYLGFLGSIFLRMLKALILPLIISSLISGLADLDSKLSGRMGWVTIVYYMSTTFTAVFLGIALVYAIKPGYYGSSADEVRKQGGRPSTVADTFLDLIRSMFPSNLIGACITQESTMLIVPKGPLAEPEPEIYAFQQNYTNFTTPFAEPEPTDGIDPDDPYTWMFKVGHVESGMNILGIVVFCVAFGIVIARMGKQGKPLRDFFDSMREAIMRIVNIVMWFSPIGICFLIAARIVAMRNPAQMLGRIGMYMVTVLSGLGIHAFIILPTIYIVFARKNPLMHFLGASQALLTALGTASSSATLSITISNMEQKRHIDTRVARFVLPIGATINMDGTALYEAVAVLFIAQVNGVSLDAGKIIALRYRDRFRTAVNVWGDAVGSGVVAHVVRDSLDHADEVEAATMDYKGDIIRGFHGHDDIPFKNLPPDAIVNPSYSGHDELGTYM
ncbi:PREDICTED: excitatory amino acid transporter 1-like [Priapulus caudatus]|uniref:Amino acid transporter n=1 Tax=Priapulus caudatus TaxID=37621 RepID=A0ABM1EF51_PRICU|nr:PREDICTED: excitatory amino acid transporter 1-like [Priapulus caudatus]